MPIIIALIGYAICITLLAVCRALSVESADTITIVAFTAAIIINRWAALFVAAHLMNDWLFDVIDSGIYYNLLSGLFYAFIGSSNIRISYELRQVFISLGALFWLCAVDFYLFPTAETMLYNSFAYIVSAVDLYALFLLLYGGRRFDRINGPAAGNSNFWLPDLQLLQACFKKAKR